MLRIERCNKPFRVTHIITYPGSIVVLIFSEGSSKQFFFFNYTESSAVSVSVVNAHHYFLCQATLNRKIVKVGFSNLEQEFSCQRQREEEYQPARSACFSVKTKTAPLNQ